MLTSPPPGHGRIEMEMSSKNTAPDGSRTKPGNFANEGQVDPKVAYYANADADHSATFTGP